MDTSFAALLRKYRVEAGLSQAALAERANVSAGAIGSLEQGTRRAPYRATLENLADALNLTAEQRDRLVTVGKRTPKGGRGTEPARPFHSNVPTALTSFVPRKETAELEQLLTQHRLVTVTGSAGVGKTRTVLEVVAKQHTIDVYFLDLSPISDADLVAAEIAAAFQMPTHGASNALAEIVLRLGDRRALIVLDNCEHVLAGASATVLELLRSCSGLQFIATSREPLGLSGEILFRLPSLAVPPIGNDLTLGPDYPALDLFVLRARAADARIAFSGDDLIAAAEICRRLDGIPLAIELAACRAPLLGINGLRNRMNVLALDNFAKDAPMRHQTMMTAIAWSFTLLSARERTLIARLAT